MGYDYEALTADIDKICGNYDFVGRFSIGKSVMGRDIFCIKLGVGKKKLFLAGAFHGLEYITAAFLVKFAAEYAEKYSAAALLFDYDIRRLFDKVTLYIIPMVNPDGADIAVNGLNPSDPYHRRLANLVGIQDFR